MEIKDALSLMVSFGGLIIALLTLVVMIVALIQKK